MKRTWMILIMITFIIIILAGFAFYIIIFTSNTSNEDYALKHTPHQIKKEHSNTPIDKEVTPESIQKSR